MFISCFIQANYFKKYLKENAVNTISEPPDFKIFWGGGGGGCPQTLLQTRASGARFQPPHLEIRPAVPAIWTPLYEEPSSGGNIEATQIWISLPNREFKGNED